MLCVPRFCMSCFKTKSSTPRHRLFSSLKPLYQICSIFQIQTSLHDLPQQQMGFSFSAVPAEDYPEVLEILKVVLANCEMVHNCEANQSHCFLEDPESIVHRRKHWYGNLQVIG